MRGRWQTISDYWERNKTVGSKLSLLDNLDYQLKLSAQLDWQENSGGRPIRVIYTKAGQPTASILYNDAAFAENVLFWIACKDINEAYYLLAIINSDVLYQAVTPLMNKGQYGARDLHKQLWKLPIPEYYDGVPLHQEIATAGATAAAGVAEQLAELREKRGEGLTVKIARRELRKWLYKSAEGLAVEHGVKRLLSN